MNKRVCSIIAVVLATAAFSFPSFSEEKVQNETGGSMSLTMWVCPVGAFSAGEKNADTDTAVSAFVTDLFPEASIAVDIEVMETSEMKKKFSEGEMPDLLFTNPEVILEQIRTGMSFADLSEMRDAASDAEINPTVLAACQEAEGGCFLWPVAVNVRSMAINKTMFEEAGAMQYLAEATHSWKDSGFIDSVLRIYDHLVQKDAENTVVGRYFCQDQSGVRGTMSFAENLYNAPFLNDETGEYDLERGGIQNVFETLQHLKGKGIEFDPEINADGEREAFLNGELYLSFNWDLAAQKAYETVSESDASGSSFEIMPIMYPASDNIPDLTGEIWGFAVCDRGEDEKREAATALISDLNGDAARYQNLVELIGCLPVRDRVDGTFLSEFYTGDAAARLYRSFLNYFRTYQESTPGYGKLEEMWPEIVRKIAAGEKMNKVLEKADQELNRLLKETDQE